MKMKTIKMMSYMMMVRYKHRLLMSQMIQNMNHTRVDAFFTSERGVVKLF